MRPSPLRTLPLCMLMIGLSMPGLLMGCTGSHAAGSFFLTGEADPGQERAVNEAFSVASKAETEVDPSIMVLVASIPEGISLSDSLISVDEGYAHEIIGKLRLDPPAITGVCQARTMIEFSLLIGLIDPTYYSACTASVTHEGLIEEAKRMAGEAGGDLVIGNYLGSKPGKSAAYGFEGWIIRRDARFKTQPLETTPAEMSQQEI